MPAVLWLRIVKQAAMQRAHTVASRVTMAPQTATLSWQRAQHHPTALLAHLL